MAISPSCVFAQLLKTRLPTASDVGPESSVFSVITPESRPARPTGTLNTEAGG